MTDGVFVCVGIDLGGADDLRAHIKLKEDLVSVFPYSFDFSISTGTSFHGNTVDGECALQAPCGNAQGKGKFTFIFGLNTDFDLTVFRVIRFGQNRYGIAVNGLRIRSG